MSEIIWYLSFSDWFISLSIMFSRSIHALTKDKIFFFFYGRSACHCVNSYFIHSFTDDGHFSCFQILAIVNNTAINIGVLCSFELVFQISLGNFPEVELLGHKTVLHLSEILFVFLLLAYFT